MTNTERIVNDAIQHSDRVVMHESALAKACERAAKSIQTLHNNCMNQEASRMPTRTEIAAIIYRAVREAREL